MSDSAADSAATTFSPEQQRALDARNNVIVSAGAGSGKTRVLVEKYFRLLVDEHPDWPLDSVVAITFTRKAAAEMRERVARRCDDALAATNLDPTTRQRVTQLRSRIANLPIQTNDAFFARLLRQHPVESHVDPDFEVLGDVEEQRLRRDAIRTVLDAAMNQPVEIDESLEVIALLSRHYAQGLSNLLSGLLSNRAELAHVLERYRTLSADALHAEVVEQFPAWFQATLGPMAQKFTDALAIVAARATGITGLGELATIARRSFVANTDTAAIREGLAALAAAHDKLCIASGKRTLRKKVIDALPDVASLDAARIIEDVSRRLRPESVAFPGRADKLLIQRMQAIVRLYDKVHAELQRLKCSVPTTGLLYRLDFQDLAIAVHRLVTGANETLRVRLSQDIRMLILDEFQDTSRIQWEIFFRLIADPTTAALRPASLFAVGDAKQSIYRFRAADVRVFLEAVKHLATSNAGEVVAMHTNYRTQESTLESINKTFDKVFPADQNAATNHGVPFEILQPARPADGGDVAWHELYEQHDDADDLDDSHTDDAAATRRTPCFDPEPVASALHEAHERGIPWRDMVILTRTRKEFDEYRNALDARAIPVVAMRRLTVSSEIVLQGLIHLMAAAVRPGSNLALAAVLGGPFVNAPLETLLRAGLGAEGSLRQRLEQAMHDPADSLNARDTALIKTAFDLLDFARSRAETCTVPEFLEAIITRTQSTALLAARLGAEATRQALGALRARAEDFRARTLADALDYFETTSDVLGSDTAELGTLDLAPHEDKVRIMTVHASKGLEFPIVHVVGLEQPGHGVDRAILSDRTHWLAAKEEFDSDELETPEQSHLYDRIRRDEEDAEREERKRLLYVAATRARNELHLWTSRAPASAKSSDTEIFKPFDARSMAALLEPARAALIGNIIDEPCARTPTTVETVTHLTLAHLDGLAHRVAESLTNTFDTAATLLDSFRPRTGITRLLNFMEDPARHFQYFVVGDLPDYLRPGATHGTNESTDTLSATDRGNIVHAAIAHFIKRGPDFAREFLAKEITQLMRQLPPARIDEQATELLDLLQRAVSAGMFSALRDRLDDANFEYPVGGVCGPLELVGAADVVLRDPNTGAWSLLEFKTDRSPSPEVKAHHRQQVQIYMALLSRSLGPCAEYRATIHYLTLGQSVDVLLTPQEMTDFSQEATAWCTAYANFLQTQARSERIITPAQSPTQTAAELAP